MQLSPLHENKKNYTRPFLKSNKRSFIQKLFALNAFFFRKYLQIYISMQSDIHNFFNIQQYMHYIQVCEYI
jgi:hypothetical protein